MKKILFVCTGNTCRSCMAEGIFNSLVTEAGVRGEDFKAVSAGIAALDGEKASKNAVDALFEEWGIDISGHVSKGIRHEDIQEAWLILTMTRSHKNAILAMFPEANGKVYTLKEYVYNKNENEGEAGSLLDIPDPYGMPLDEYKACARDIRSAVELLLEKLEKGC